MELASKIKPGLVNVDTNDHWKECSRIVCLVADRYGFTKRELLGRRRTVKHIWPRHTAMALCRLLGLTYQDVGKVFNRDHGTIIHACHNVRNLVATEPRLREEFRELRDMVEV
jgi:chromosomal replication initiator protein